MFGKSYGGLSIELGNEVIDYDDDLFLVTGYAQSIDGDLSSTPSNDGNVWTLAINKVSGVMEWYALNGGSVGTEYGRTVCKTSYNGFIFGAIATTNNDLITTAHGFNDFGSLPGLPIVLQLQKLVILSTTIVMD